MFNGINGLRCLSNFNQLRSELNLICEFEAGCGFQEVLRHRLGNQVSPEPELEWTLEVMNDPHAGERTSARRMPSNPVAVSHPVRPTRAAPGLAMPYPVSAVESGTLSAQARRGLDCALAVWVGVGCFGGGGWWGCHMGRPHGGCVGLFRVGRWVSSHTGQRLPAGVKRTTVWVALWGCR